MDAVLFDFDGTLADTMPLHCEAYRRTFAEMGLELSREQFFSNIGGAARETIPKFLGGRATTWSVEQIHRRKKELYSELLRTTTLPTLPTAELLPLLYQRIPLALATSGSRSGVMEMLERLGWRSMFGAIVTGDDVVRSKPDPEIFLTAAKRLGVAPEKCLVFEDTDDGVAAGLAAGCRVFDVRKAASPVAGKQ